MEANYAITEDEYVKANQLFSRLPPKALITYFVVCVVIALLALIAGSLVLQIATLAAIAISFLGVYAARKIFAPMQTRKQYRHYKAAQESITISIDDNGIKFESAIGDAVIDWKRIFKWREDEQFLLIYQAPQIYHVVPKRIGELAIELSTSLSENVGVAS